jgi:hypothetical protein
MTRSLPQATASICRACLISQRLRVGPTISAISWSTRAFSAGNAPRKQHIRKSKPQTSKTLQPPSNAPVEAVSPLPVDTAQSSANSVVGYELSVSKLKSQADKILAGPELPLEKVVLDFLALCERSATSSAGVTDEIADIDPKTNSHSSAMDELISLNGDKTKPIPLSVAEQPTTDAISALAFDLVSSPTVFISEPILRVYTQLQVLLSRPERIPYVFELFASKPQPVTQNTFRPAKPAAASSAIPIKSAKLALKSALEAKNLDLAIAIIEASTALPTFRKRKVVAKVLPLGIAFFGLLPPAAWALSSQFAHWQNTLEPKMATGVAFSGILAYVFFTSTLGYVSITTRNDQMERVTWMPGMPLRERWLREEERAMCDLVAQEWGFKNIRKRGEEDGIEWDLLRQWLGRRGMRLDFTENLPGMQ